MLKNKFKGIIYLDLDGVLADFDSYAEKLILASNTKIKNENDWWNILKTDQNFFYNLKPMPYAMSILKAAQAVTSNVQILTALPAKHTFPNAKEDKCRWVEKYLGKSMKVNFGPYSKDKWKHAKPGDILVDDKLSNIQQWKKLANCPAILHIHNNYMDTIDKLRSLA